MEIRSNEHFDTVIIGCGMAGLAAGIRLAHFGRKVVILERHNAPGGLNSFYSFDGRKYDVGLHAVTNYVPAGVKGTPLGKLLRQLRIPREEFDLCEQAGSKVAFPGVELRFSNDFALFESEVARAFPAEVDNFRRLVAAVVAFDDTALDGAHRSAREVVGRYLRDPLLADLLFCPLMYYGSARENDMDFAQFAIMFKAIFREGFARPFEGVRQVIRVLIKRYRALGGVRKMKCGVRRIVTGGGAARGLVLDDGTEITADHILSSAGRVETLRMCDDDPPGSGDEAVGRLSFVETITILDREPAGLGWDDTIIFFNDSERFDYRRPDDLVDPRSGVICFPNNYRYGDGRELAEGVFRVTAMANFDRWTELPEEVYRAEKEAWYGRLAEQALHFLPPLPPGVTVASMTKATDMFTPRTVKKYTGHFAGAIYGAPEKARDGRTHLDNLFLCGTDQGFLGIVGAMLSGISMANYHILGRK